MAPIHMRRNGATYRIQLARSRARPNPERPPCQDQPAAIGSDHDTLTTRDAEDYADTRKTARLSGYVPKVSVRGAPTPRRAAGGRRARGGRTRPAGGRTR